MTVTANDVQSGLENSGTGMALEGLLAINGAAFTNAGDCARGVSAVGQVGLPSIAPAWRTGAVQFPVAAFSAAMRFSGGTDHCCATATILAGPSCSNGRQRVSQE